MMQKSPPVAPLRFDVSPSELVNRAKYLLAASAAVWNNLAKISPEDASFANVILPILQDENALSESNYLGWYNACSPSKELRDASTEVDRIFREYKVGRFTRQDIFQLVRVVSDRRETLDEEDQLGLVRLREQFSENGLGLGDDASRTRMTQIARKTKEISQAYVRNLDSNTAGLWLSMDELEGVPQSYLKRWKADGDRRWVDFKMPNVMAIFRNAKSPTVRRRYWTEWENRFRDNNGPLQKEMVCLRDEAARLMGYPHHAKRKEVDRMLDTETVQKFLSQLQVVLRAPAEARLKALSEIKADLADAEDAHPTTIFKWDEWYFSQLYDKAQYRIDQEKIAEYFPLERALSSIMKLLEKLFGLTFVRLDTNSSEVTTWHPDVRVFAVWNEDESEEDEFLGFLYLDLFPRDFKYGHKGHYCLHPVSPSMAIFLSLVLALIDGSRRASFEETGLGIIPVRSSWPTTPPHLNRVPASSSTMSFCHASTSSDTQFTTSHPLRNIRDTTERRCHVILSRYQAYSWNTSSSNATSYG